VTVETVDYEDGRFGRLQMRDSAANRSAQKRKAFA
jgi:hypothetical protein